MVALPDARSARARDGKPNLTAKVPRAPNGKPDLSGVWQAEYAPPGEIERLLGDGIRDFVVPGDDPRNFSKYFINMLADFKPEEAPMRPEAAKLFQRHSQGGYRESPSTRCVPQGIPRGDLDNYLPFKIIQAPGVIAVLYEESYAYRQIYTDGRKLPVDPQPSWMGYSVGHWEGDELVVDANGFNDEGWLDAMGHPQSDRGADSRQRRIGVRLHGKRKGPRPSREAIASGPGSGVSKSPPVAEKRKHSAS